MYIRNNLVKFTDNLPFGYFLFKKNAKTPPYFDEKIVKSGTE